MRSVPEHEPTQANLKAWNRDRYAAWTAAYGPAADQAKRIVADPEHVIRRLSPYLGSIEGKRICNVQGSHGRIAVALSLLGAEVQVIDFAQENRRYALDLAKAANVEIDYALCDIMDAPQLHLPHKFDWLVLELGILHYHQNLLAFFDVMRRLARDGGKLILNEFHPVHRKLFWPDGPKDYFDGNLIVADVPNPLKDASSLGTCHYRFWTMGEIVTAIIQAGFAVQRLDEHPDPSNPSIPGSFTLIARL